MSTALALLGGAAVGAVQARWLGREAKRGPPAFGALLRLLLVGGVLLASALLGELVAGAVGWAVGFALAARLVHRSLA